MQEKKSCTHTRVREHGVGRVWSSSDGAKVKMSRSLASGSDHREEAENHVMQEVAQTVSKKAD